ncbi:hypothetical protein FB451DRAFT_1291524 [Mycena latifolia]|nr:hypothetical protein FB451DRAFT_1291524 [Mycena latifolia]
MGRALYSETYGVNAPKIRVEREVVPCPSKWSIYNRFDPDSDEFFEGAEYEAFMDQVPPDVDVEPLPATATDSGSGSSESDDSESGRDSPSPPVRMSAIWDRLVDESAAAEYQPVPDEQLLLDIPGYARADDARDGERVPIRVTDEHGLQRPVTVSVHPPSSLRNSTTATDLARANASAPIDIPVTRATSSEPELDSASMSMSTTPSTPPTVYTHLQMMTPSPPPTVTPRIYVWTHAPGSTASPTRHRDTHPAAGPGPLTNPGARQSLARLTPRRRAQNV